MTVTKFPKEKRDNPEVVPILYFHDCQIGGSLCFKFLIHEEDSIVYAVCTDCGDKMTMQDLLQGDIYDYED